jgi:cellulose synthase/poly-beta-1,6-N-acetylglucosamine synthase-like glycosyltransferase
MLSIIALAAIARFTVWWVTIPERWDYPVAYIGISLVIAYESAVWLTRWFPLLRMRRPAPLAPEPGLRVAVVTTIVPETEPVAMLEQTLRALVGLDYPHDTWVLDEGDDPQVRALCDRLGARHFSRRHRPEYHADSGPFASRTKYGNYNAWLDTPESTRYDFIAAFDTDHVPEHDYLERTLGYFRDPGVGYVQAPQVYYNQGESFIARGAAEETYDYYSCHQMAGYALGHPIIIGSHNLHRLAALRAVGGFPRYDAEDLRLTLLYRTHDWRGVYVPEVLALGCTPVRWRDYLVQQARWARSVLELKRGALRKSFLALPLHEWLMGLLHGVHFLRPLLWLILYPLLFRMLLNNRVPTFLRPGPLLTLACMGLLLRSIDQFRQLFYLDPRRERGLHWRAAMLQFAKWPHFVGALLDTLLRRRVAYTLTPKVAGGTERYILAPIHTGLAVSLCGAWVIGVLRTGGVQPVLTALAGLVAGASLVLAWTETWDFPPPYDPALLRRQRGLMRELLEHRAG